MSALPPKADIAERDWHVRFVPKRGHHKGLIDCRVGDAASAIIPA